MRRLSIIYPFYDNAEMLRLQLDHWMGIPSDIKAWLDFILVDDCSPNWPALDVLTEHLNGKDCGATEFWKPFSDDIAILGRSMLMGMPFSLYRIGVDVRWNWIAARNLAVDKSLTEWFFMTDMDHIIPYSTLRRMVFGDLQDGKAYKFNRWDAYRCDVDGSMQLNSVKMHPNSWLMQRKLFEAVGGYDERWSGFYGSDGEFRDRITAKSGKPLIIDEGLIRVESHIIADSETTAYQRKTPEDAAHKAKVRKMIAKSPKPHRLTFPWKKVL